MPLQITPEKTRIGWIGLGVMGSSMCGHLLDAGFATTVFTRTQSKAEDLLARGAAWADSPRAVAEESDVTFSIVGFPSDVREVMLGQQGALAGAKSGDVLVDMTTSQPSLAIEIHAVAAAKGVYSVDAPCFWRRCRCQGGSVVDHDWRRQGSCRRPRSLLECDGKNDRPSRCRRCRAAHENGESNPHRNQHDRRVRKRCCTPIVLGWICRL